MFKNEKRVTMYRYLYHEKNLRIDKFDCCYLNLAGDAYYVYEEYTNPKYDFHIRVKQLDVMNDQYSMWSLSGNKKEDFLSQVRVKKLELLRKTLDKSLKYEEELEFIDEILFKYTED